MVDVDTGHLLSYISCELSDFAKDIGIPLYREIDYTAPMKGDYQDIRKTRERFSDVYDEIRQFAFQAELNNEQKTFVNEYLKLQKQLLGEDLQKFYQMLSPEFDHWMRNALV